MAGGSWPRGSSGRGRPPPVLRRYLAKRLLVAIPSLLIASLIVFTLPRLIPGDVVVLMLAEKAYAKSSPCSASSSPS